MSLSTERWTLDVPRCNPIGVYSTNNSTCIKAEDDQHIRLLVADLAKLPLLHDGQNSAFLFIPVIQFLTSVCQNIAPRIVNLTMYIKFVESLTGHLIVQGFSCRVSRDELVDELVHHERDHFFTSWLNACAGLLRSFL